MASATVMLVLPACSMTRSGPSSPSTSLSWWSKLITAGEPPPIARASNELTPTWNVNARQEGQGCVRNRLHKKALLDCPESVMKTALGRWSVRNMDRKHISSGLPTRRTPQHSFGRAKGKWRKTKMSRSDNMTNNRRNATCPSPCDIKAATAVTITMRLTLTVEV